MTKYISQILFKKILRNFKLIDTFEFSWVFFFACVDGFYLLEEYQIIPVIEAQKIVNPFIWYSKIIQPSEHVNSKFKSTCWHPVNFGCFNCVYLYKYQRNNSAERHQKKYILDKTAKMLSTIILKAIFPNEVIGKGWLKFRQDSLHLIQKNQRLVEQARMIWEKGWFSDPEALEIYERGMKNMLKKYPPTKTETQNSENQKHHKIQNHQYNFNTRQKKRLCGEREREREMK